jgi:hypothetical protein
MKRRPDLSQKDWELCCLYLGELKGQDISAHEPWERELEAWAADPDRYPRRSTVAKLRLRFPNTPRSTE